MDHKVKVYNQEKYGSEDHKELHQVYEQDRQIPKPQEEAFGQLLFSVQQSKNLYEVIKNETNISFDLVYQQR